MRQINTKHHITKFKIGVNNPYSEPYWIKMIKYAKLLLWFLLLAEARISSNSL